ncbi:MAG: tRNA pseudouridine(38-40) synthase TruA [Clostridia bacterium]|nr:tRNA pseudouridine(38-40) synthase TruA [Clostridia bacterium]
MKYALLIAYDGTHYGGWQIQKNKITVQQKLEEAAAEVFGKKTSVTASGRTDSGVHAAGQVCTFFAETSIPAEKLAEAFNMRLPRDISVLKSAAAPQDFDVIKSAKRKTYCYRFYLSSRRNPLKDRFSAWVKLGADIEKLKHIAGAFVGVHDFKAYQKSGSDVKTTVREIYSVDVKTRFYRGSQDVEIYVCGNGFLYNMVRTIAGTMLYFASGVLSEDDVMRSLNGGDRNSVGKTMPPQGLTLEEVDYGFKLF